MNKDIFDPTNQTISDIFSFPGIYVIPNYQRQYTWVNEHLEQLWSDLYESFENDSNKCYFLGSIVVVDRLNGEHELVDGQQRITTLMIMLNVLSKTFPNLNKNNQNILKGNKSTINKLIYHDSSINKLKLQTDPNYDTMFKTNITNVKKYSNLSEPTKKELNQETPVYKYINTAKFFYQKFNELYKKDHKVLDEFVNFILFKTNIIKITCYDQSFAIKLFLVLNDRGADLSSSDIIKTKIYDKFDRNKKYNQNDRQIFNSNWKHIETICKNNDLKMDEFMTCFEYYKLRKNPKKQITEELGKIIDDDKTEINSFVVELKNFADNVNKVFTSQDKIIYSLRYIPWQSYVISAIASAYQVNYPNQTKLFSIMRRFFYIALISGKTLNGIKQTSFNLIDAIVMKKSIDEIEKILNNFINSNNLVRDAYQALDDDVYGEKFLKPLMLSIEYEIREEINKTFYVIDKNIHMDHILPKMYQKKAKEWPNITNIEKTKPYLNKLGNMALLLGKKNEEALNYGFDKKIRIYQGQDTNKSGKTVFDTTNMIIDEYNKAPLSKKVWDVAHIKTRQKYLMNQIEDMLDISRNETEKDNTIEIEINDETKGTITEELIEKVYELSKDVYENKIEYQQAIEKMSEYGMNNNSAGMYIDCFLKMMGGYTYKRHISKSATEYYITKIREDYGLEYSKKAIESLSKHINYLNNKNYSHPGLEEVLKKQIQIDNN